MDNNISAKLKELSSDKPSDWSMKAKFMLENKKWLDYSAQIALRIDSIIEENKELNQATLAKSLKMSPQQISRILRGDQNLTLKTISKLSDVLGFELISFPAYKDTYVQLQPYTEINPSVQAVYKYEKQGGSDNKTFSMNIKQMAI